MFTPDVGIDRRRAVFPMAFRDPDLLCEFNGISRFGIVDLAVRIAWRERTYSSSTRCQVVIMETSETIKVGIVVPGQLSQFQ